MFKIFSEDLEHKDLYLRLVPHCGDVALVVCDRNGIIVDKGFILCITHDGYVNVYSGLNQNIGLKIKNGEIERER